MDFPSVDLFDDDADDTPRVDQAEVDRQNYVAKVCRLSADKTHFSVDRDGVKMTADLAYYMKDYRKALSLYRQLYTEFGCNSLSVKRDILECLVRSLLAVGDVKTALGHWEEIQEGWTGHEDQRLVVAQLRVDIARQEGDWGEEIGALICQLVEMHNTFTRYWVWLADWYRENKEEVKEFSSLVRAKEVGRLEGVKCSLKLELLDVRIKSSKVDQVVQERIQEVICRDFRDKAEEDEVVKEFEDLGTSVRMKKVEEAFAERANVNENSLEAANVIYFFEQKWFSFLQ